MVHMEPIHPSMNRQTERHTQLKTLQTFIIIKLFHAYVTAAASGTEYSGEGAASDLLVTYAFVAAWGNSCLA